VRVEVGHPAARLAEVIDEERAELVVIGSERHGRRRRPTVRARLATELGERTSVPVLVAAPAPLAARRSAGDRRARGFVARVTPRAPEGGRSARQRGRC
jgi:hypothetical protein